MEHAIDCYRRFLGGDNSGLEEIICRFKDGLILYLNGYVNNLSVAEELTEETFVKMVVKRPRFSQQSAFKTWLYTIGRNTAIDHLRRNKKVELPLEDCLQICDEEAGLERSYIRQEDKIMLHRCIKQLKQEYQQVQEIGLGWSISSELAVALHEDPTVPLSSIRDTITVMINYENGTTETLIFDITIDDLGKIFVTQRGIPNYSA